MDFSSVRDARARRMAEGVVKGLRWIVLCLMLPGCLSTKTAVFDEGNSIRAGDSAELARIDAVARALLPDGDGGGPIAPPDDRVVELGGLVIVEERSSSGEGEYFGYATLGPRPVICVAHDEKMQALADRHGVTVMIARSDDMKEEEPAGTLADGPKDKLYDFVIAAFAEGTLVCRAPPAIR